MRQVTLHLAPPAVTGGAGGFADSGPGHGGGFQRGGQPRAAKLAEAAPDDVTPRWVAAGVDITA